VSQWGHDFRPDYFRLADAARTLGAAAIVASTATATPRVAADVARRLGLRDPLRVATGFDRPNIAFAVARPAPHEKRALVVEALRREDALPAIVYAGTRAGAQELAGELSAALGEEAAAYHAGLDRGLRAEVQRRFLADDVRVICATNAFGMGVDKPNVRTVLHASVPASLEAYYQEAGRAGRDGRAARALLLAENRDKALHVHFIKRDEIDAGLPGWLADRIAAAADGDGRYLLDAAGLARDLGGDGDRLRALIGHLTRAGVIAPTPSAPDQIAGRVLRRFDGRAAALCRSSVEDGAKARWRQYREIWAYVERTSCRREAILRHFGDRAAVGAGSSAAPGGLASADQAAGALTAGAAAAGPADQAAIAGGRTAGLRTVPDATDPAPVRRPCCDACDPGLVPAPPPPDPVELRHLDDAIVSVARGARPAVGRTTCAEILHGGRGKKLLRNSYDGLPAYGTSSRMRRADILARVDELIEEGQLEVTSGPYPVLRLPARAAA